MFDTEPSLWVAEISWRTTTCESLLTYEVANDFFTQPNGRPNFRSPTYLVQLQGQGERKIYKYEGLNTLNFHSVQGGLPWTAKEF